MISEAQLNVVVRVLTQQLTQACFNQHIIDFAHIGNTSGAYRWAPCLVADVDIWVLSDSFSHETGRSLFEISGAVIKTCAAHDIACEVRAIDGPYKPLVLENAPAILLLHLLVDTAESYSGRNAFTRWSWRKYKCFNRSERLKEMAPAKPQLTDLIDAKWGPKDGMKLLSADSIEFAERLLPSMVQQKAVFSANRPEFLELCFYLAAVNARNHARALNFPEADLLSNEEFIDWYTRKVFASDSLNRVMLEKNRLRQFGVCASIQRVRGDAVQYLSELAHHLA